MGAQSRMKVLLLNLLAVIAIVASASEVTLYAQQTELFQSSLETSDDLVSNLVDGTSQVESLADLYPEDGTLGLPHKEVTDDFVSQLVVGSSAQPESLADIYPEDATLGHMQMLLQSAATPPAGPQKVLLQSVLAEVEKRITNPQAKAKAFKLIKKLAGKHLKAVLRSLKGGAHAPDWNPKIRKLVKYILAQQAVKRGVETFQAPDKKHLEQDDITSTRVMPKGGEESVNGKFDQQTPSGKKVLKTPVHDEIGVRTSIQNQKGQTGV